MLEKSMLFLSLMWVLPHILPEVEPLAVEFPAFPNAAREDDKSCHAFALIRILEKGSVDLLDVGGVTYRHTRASGAISQQFGWVSEYCQEAIATALEDWRYPTRKSGMQTVIRFSFELCLPTDCPSSRQKYLPPGEITVYAELLPPSRDSQLRADTPARLYPVEEGQSHLDVAGSRGEHRTNPLDRLQYVRIGPANARFGCRGGDCSFLERSSEQPTKIEGFWLGATEVTVGAYRRFAEAAGQEMPPPRFFDRNWENSDLPIVNVTWDEARTYCEWIGGRLPSEDEWEYAAAGGNTDDSYPWGPELSHDDANYPYLSQKEGIDFYLRRVRDLWYYEAPVARFPANGFGLFDMVGNVEEWVSDRFKATRRETEPTFSSRAVRGGSWASETPNLLRLSFRYGQDPAKRASIRGFRCVWKAPAP